MTVGKSLDYRTILKVPYYNCTIFGARGHVPVAMADCNIHYNFLVAMERGLKNKVVLIPDFDDSTTKVKN